MTSNLKIEVEGLTKEEKKQLEDTLKRVIDNMSEETRIEYLKDVRLTFSANNSIKRTRNHDL